MSEKEETEGDSWRQLETVTSFDKSSSSENEYEEASKPNAGLFSPSSILIESLIEQILLFSEKDPDSRKVLYFTICQQLNELKLIDKSYLVEDFNFIRNYYRKELHRLINVVKAVPSTAVQKYNVPTTPIFTKNTHNNEYGKLFEWSRYRNEFIELAFIARGGFGEVVKVQHMLDATIYAVKKICLKYCSINGFIRGLSEVQMLAQLNHPNIVSYKAAWLEPLITVGRRPKESKTAIRDNDKTESKDNDSSDVVFMYSEHTKNSLNNHTNYDSSLSSSDANDSTNENNNHKNALIGEGPFEKHLLNHKLLYFNKENNNFQHECGQDWAVLFIQMQLCNQTLRQWLDLRNNTTDTPVNIKQSFYIISEILKGIEFIHSKGIVHHDIKPNNIFISKDEKEVQIGDFGLSCCLLHDTCPERSAVSIFSLPNCPVSVVHRPGEIGTKLYAAPEQLNGICNSKSDLYSLGILLFELMYSVHTDMERIKRITDLRKGILPKDLLTNFPEIAQLIKRLVARNLDDRPNATEVLNEISELTATEDCDIDKDETIKRLQKELHVKNELIVSLQKQLSLHQLSTSVEETLQLSTSIEETLQISASAEEIVRVSTSVKETRLSSSS